MMRQAVFGGRWVHVHAADRIDRQRPINRLIRRAMIMRVGVIVAMCLAGAAKLLCRRHF
jgi:hypothetical protein